MSERKSLVEGDEECEAKGLVYEALRREEKMLLFKGREERRRPRLRFARIQLSKSAIELEVGVGFRVEVEGVGWYRSRSWMNSLNATPL